MPEPASPLGAYWNNPSSRWDTGLRWGTPGPVPNKHKVMAILTCNISELTIPQRLVKGQEFITMGTNNPDVPGNATQIAALTAAQASLLAANAAYEESRQTTKQLMQARDMALLAWNNAVNMLGATTESVTGGVAEKILSAGFGVKAEPVPPQPTVQVENVKVGFTGMPGHSKVQWKRETYADAYVVERSPDPITPTSWDNVGTVTEPKYEGNGAIPGQKYWYRVAAVNRLGQGPWSEPALRPVM